MPTLKIIVFDSAFTRFRTLIAFALAFNNDNKLRCMNDRIQIEVFNRMGIRERYNDNDKQALLEGLRALGSDRRCTLSQKEMGDRMVEWIQVPYAMQEVS